MSQDILTSIKVKTDIVKDQATVTISLPVHAMGYLSTIPILASEMAMGMKSKESNPFLIRELVNLERVCGVLSKAAMTILDEYAKDCQGNQPPPPTAGRN